MSILDRVLCGLFTKHRSALKAYTAGRVYLRCACGWESAGWTCGKSKVRPFQNLILVRGSARRAA